MRNIFTIALQVYDDSKNTIKGGMCYGGEPAGYGSIKGWRGF